MKIPWDKIRITISARTLMKIWRLLKKWRNEKCA